MERARGRLSPSMLNANSFPNLYLPEISRTRQTVRTLRRGIVIPHTLVSERGIGGHGRKAIRRDRSRFPPLAFFLAQRNLSAARKWPAEQPACVSNISMMTLVFEDRAAALEALQPQKSRGENDALLEDTAPALHACCQGHPWWLIVNGAGETVTTLRKLVTMKIERASDSEGKYRGGTNWGLPMLVQDRVVMMWQTYSNHTPERASVQLIEVASTISVSALNANEIALITGCVHLPRGRGVDPGATFPHAIVATTLMSDERSSGGSEGWRKSGAGAASWGEATAAVSYAGLGRAVDTPGTSGRQTLVAMVKTEGGSGKVWAGTVGERNELGYPSLGYDIDRLGRRGYRVDGRGVSDGITDRLATAAAMPLVSGAASDKTPVGSGLEKSDARRQGAWMVATTSPDDLDVVR